jgi:hypothetical protein
MHVVVRLLLGRTQVWLLVPTSAQFPAAS